MQFTFALVACLFAAFSVDAVPIAAPQDPVTLPLTRIPRRTDLHPLVVRNRPHNRRS